MTGQRAVIDLNADLGEGFGAWRLADDDRLLTLVTSANVACGFHGGDPRIMRTCCASAVRNNVAIGAQVSYRDLAGFGRREMEVPLDELTAEVLYQIAALDGIARAEGGRVRYVKPHGALYNRAVRDPVQAGALIAAIAAYDPGLSLLTLPGASARAAAAAGIPVVIEGFADRAYASDGTLLPRHQPGAVLSDPGQAAWQAVTMATGGGVLSARGEEMAVCPRSICVHGDTPGSIAMVQAVREGLEAAGVSLASFT